MNRSDRIILAYFMLTVLAGIRLLVLHARVKLTQEDVDRFQMTAAHVRKKINSWGDLSVEVGNLPENL